MKTTTMTFEVEWTDFSYTTETVVVEAGPEAYATAKDEIFARRSGRGAPVRIFFESQD